MDGVGMGAGGAGGAGAGGEEGVDSGRERSALRHILPVLA